MIFYIKLYFKKLFYTGLYVVILYFIYFSNYGIKDFLYYRLEIKNLQIECEKLKKEANSKLEKINKLKDDENLDIDLLETQVRDILCYTRKSEDVYYWK